MAENQEQTPDARAVPAAQALVHAPAPPAPDEPQPQAFVTVSTWILVAHVSACISLYLLPRFLRFPVRFIAMRFLPPMLRFYLDLFASPSTIFHAYPCYLVSLFACRPGSLSFYIFHCPPYVVSTRRLGCL